MALDSLSKAAAEKLKSTLSGDYYTPISVIVPAFNEEVTIVETVKSLLSLEYTNYEVIVVDDGSTDTTSKRLIETFRMVEVRRPIVRRVQCQPEECIFESFAAKVPLTLIRKKNGGKADSLNMGINAAKYPYFICMDADSVLQYDSLSKIASCVLEDENIVAVGGVVHPSNGVTLENGRIRDTECPRMLSLLCRFWSKIAPSWLQGFSRQIQRLSDYFGAFGLFKKKLLSQQADMTLQLLVRTWN